VRGASALENAVLDVAEEAQVAVEDLARVDLPQEDSKRIDIDMVVVGLVREDL